MLLAETVEGAAQSVVTSPAVLTPIRLSEPASDFCLHCTFLPYLNVRS